MMKLSQIIFAAAALSVAGCANQNQLTASSAPAIAAPQYPVITKLVGRNQTIVISAGPSAAVYSVQSPDGQILVANASLKELRVNHPEYYRFVQPVVANEASFVIAGVE